MSRTRSATSLACAISMMTLLAYGCVRAKSASAAKPETKSDSAPKPEAKPESALKPQGFRTSSSLSGGFPNRYNPQEDGKVFLVIKVAVPTKEFIPTEAEYSKLKSQYDADKKKTDEQKTDKTEGKSQMSPLSIRKDCRVYDSERFTITLADGRGRHGQLIALDDGFDMFASSFSSWHTPEDKKFPSETVDVAFLVDEEAAKPPFRLQIDLQTPVAVPDKKIEK